MKCGTGAKAARIAKTTGNNSDNSWEFKGSYLHFKGYTE